MVVLVLVSAILVVIILLLALWYARMYKYRHVSFPGPKPIPFLGNILEYGNTTVDFLDNIMRMSRQYGPVVKIWQGPRLSLLITHPDYFEPILTSNVNISKSSGYDLYRDWLGDGLLISTGNKWRKHRKIITPTFHFKILEQFTDIYFTSGKILITCLKDVSTKESVDIFPFINLYALDVICESAMGIKMNVQENESCTYTHAIHAVLEILIKRFFSIFRRNDFLFQFTRDYKLWRKHVKELKEFTMNVVEKRREERKNTKSTDYVDAFGLKRRVAFLDLLLDVSQDGGVLTDQDIREEVETFMFEGHDTVTSAMSFGLFEIAKHEDVQKLIRQEIEECVGDQPAISLKNLQEMTYLDRVVKEILRMYPSAPFYERDLSEDVELDGITVPSGTTITLLPYAAHLDPKIYPEPEKFDPDRFLPENSRVRHPFAYLPFSAGPRNCIGQRYAMNTVKATLAYILRNFDLSPVVPEHKLVIGNHAVMRSLNGYPIKLKIR